MLPQLCRTIWQYLSPRTKEDEFRWPRSLRRRATHAQDAALPRHSIGCAPCTRVTRPGEDERAGRWWWETVAVKECGLHVTTSEAALAGPDNRVESTAEDALAAPARRVDSTTEAARTSPGGDA